MDGELDSIAANEKRVARRRARWLLGGGLLLLIPGAVVALALVLGHEDGPLRGLVHAFGTSAFGLILFALGVWQAMRAARR